MRPTQAQIEQSVGINEEVAKHMMAGKTAAAKTAIGLLRLQVNFCEHAGMALLQEAVADCKKEMGKKARAAKERP